MPSDDRAAQALAALEPRIGRFRAAVTAALEQSGAFLATRDAGATAQVARLAGELGLFASGRVDAARFAAQFGNAGPLADDTRRGVERAIATLEELWDRGNALFTVSVPRGGSLHETVAGALTECGRAFGAALVVEYARQDVLTSEHESLVYGLPFERWNRAERRLAPPLLVEVEGADLAANGLAAFVDEGSTLVLLVHGACGPAPLARLVTPGVFVMQTADVGALEQLPADAPAVVALVGAGAATFVHDPRTGGEPRERLRVLSRPDAPRRAQAGLSAWQQQEELALLDALATSAPAREGAAAEHPSDTSETLSTDPVDRLAAWLLAQSGPAA